MTLPPVFCNQVSSSSFWPKSSNWVSSLMLSLAKRGVLDPRHIKGRPAYPNKAIKHEVYTALFSANFQSRSCRLGRATNFRPFKHFLAGTCVQFHERIKKNSFRALYQYLLRPLFNTILGLRAHLRIHSGGGEPFSLFCSLLHVYPHVYPHLL